MRLLALAFTLLWSVLSARAAEFATSAETIRLPPAGIEAPDAALRELLPTCTPPNARCNLPAPRVKPSVRSGRSRRKRAPAGG